MLASFLKRSRNRRTLLSALLFAGVPLAACALTLTWDASVSPEVTGYKLHHGTWSGVYSHTIDVGNVLTYTIPDGSLAAPGVPNYIAATAYGLIGDPPIIQESVYSNEVTYTVAQSEDTEPPTPPGAPSVSVVSPSQLTLTWTASTDNIGVTGYRVERCTGASCTTGFSEIAQPGTTSYNDTGLTASTPYGYRVRAADAAPNFSDYTGIAYGTTPSAPASSLVAAWGFPEGTGTTSTDQSGMGHTMTLQGATWTTSGHTGTGIALSGTGQFLTSPDTDALDLTASGTLSAWLMLTALGRWHGIISKGAANSDQAHNYAIEVTDANVPICVLGTGTSANTLTATSALTVDTWYHVACAWDGTTMRLYVNGAPAAAVAQTLTPVGNTTPLSLGQFGNGFDRLQGVLDDVRLYNTARTEGQIVEDMQTPVGAGIPPAGATNATVQFHQ